MRMLDLALKDLRQIFRDWKAAAFLVIMPVAFTLLLGFVFSGSGGEADARLPVGLLDQDDNPAFGIHLLHLLEASETIRPQIVQDSTPDELREQVRAGDLAAAVVVPHGYSAGIFVPGEAPQLRLIVIADQSSSGGQAAYNGIQGAVTRLLGAAQAASLTARAFEAQGGTADAPFLEEAMAWAVKAWQDPPLTVTASQSDASGEGAPETMAEPNTYAHSSAGIMVQFAMAGLIGAAEIVVLERKTGALRRLLTTPISRIEIILGHFLAMLAMILLQLVILVAFGQLVLDVNYMGAPLGTVLMILVTALWAASLGLLVGTFAKTEEQVIIFTLLLMLILAGLGGAWMPLETTSEVFQTVGHLTPTAWAIDGFENIVVRGLGLESVWLPAAILLGYAVLFFAVGVWRFKFE